MNTFASCRAVKNSISVLMDRYYCRLAFKSKLNDSTQSP